MMKNCKECGNQTESECGTCEEPTCIDCMKLLLCENCSILEEINFTHELISKKIDRPLKFLRSKLYNDERQVLDKLLNSITEMDAVTFEKSIGVMRLLLTKEAMFLLERIIDVCKFIPEISLEFDDKMKIHTGTSNVGFRVL